MTRRRSNFRLALEGVGRLGEVSVRDVAAFLDAIVTLVASGAYESIGKPAAQTGRYLGPVEAASKIRLVSLKSGSLVANIVTAEPAPLPAGLGLDAETLSERALVTVMDAAEHDLVAAQHPRLALALVEAYDQSAGRWPNSVISIEDLRHRQRHSVSIDRRRSDQLKSIATRATLRPMSGQEITGRLYEADFDKRTAHVRTPSDDIVEVHFDASHDDVIQRFLRGRTTLIVDVTFSTATGGVKRTDVREVLAGSQLGLDFGGVDFWADQPVQLLIAETGAQPVTDVSELKVRGITDAEWAEVYEALARG